MSIYLNNRSAQFLIGVIAWLTVAILYGMTDSYILEWAVRIYGIIVVVWGIVVVGKNITNL